MKKDTHRVARFIGAQIGAAGLVWLGAHFGWVRGFAISLAFGILIEVGAWLQRSGQRP